MCLNESPHKSVWKLTICTLNPVGNHDASMKALPRRKGNGLDVDGGCHHCAASMKAPPKRKGNLRWLVRACSANLTLNESPSEKEGKYQCSSALQHGAAPSMKVPPKRKGNSRAGSAISRGTFPSMKVPPKRKGNFVCRMVTRSTSTLNESPSEKEGKYQRHG